MIARIGVLGVAIFSAREEVLTPPELHFVEVHGIRIRADQALHGFHGLIGAAEFVVRARHLIEDLVAVLITGVLGEQPIIESDRLERPRGICAGAYRVGRGGGVGACRNRGLRCRAPLEILIGFPQAGAGWAAAGSGLPVCVSSIALGCGAAISRGLVPVFIPNCFSSCRSARRRIASGVIVVSGVSSRKRR